MKTKLSLYRLPTRAISPRCFFLCSALALLAGCADEPESHVVSAPPPAAPGTAVVATTGTPVVVAGAPTGPIATVPTNTIVVTQAPPALQQEVVLARPSSEHVWVAGYWTWRNDRYEWMAGHWEIPPRSSATWVAPRWEPRNGAYVFYEGYWN